MIKTVLLILCSAYLTPFLQPTDTILPANDPIEFIYQWLTEEASESMTDETANEEDFEELLHEYLFLQENPVNINSEEVLRLEELGLLDAFQMEKLREYRKRFGDLLSIHELLMLESFDEPTVSVIAPVIVFGKSEPTLEQERITAGKLITRGKHQLTLNYAQKFDSTEKDYLGSPMKLQVKYTYHFGQCFRLGVVMEKDAGEPFLFHHLSDSLRNIISGYRNPGFDFYGAHLFVADVPLGHTGFQLKALAIGDYQLGFGQGLTFCSGMSFGKASGNSSVMKRAPGIRPKASASEGNFLRGAAATLRYNDLHTTFFYSIRNIDATVSQVDSLDEPMLVSALQESGYHRTLGELAKRNRLRQQVFGGHLCYAGPQLEVGMTATHSMLAAPLQLNPSKYNQFYFQGDRLTNLGLDFRWLWRNFAFFGEFAYSGNGAVAGLIGLTAKPKGYLSISVLYRNYDKRYQNLFNSAFGESSRKQGEEGFYLGIQCAPAPSCELLAYCDFFRLSWLSSQVYSPSWGHEICLNLTHQFSPESSMKLKIKSKTKMKNSADDQVFSHYPVFYTKRSVQFQLNYTLFSDFLFSSKVSYAHYLNDDADDSKGYLACQDIAYKPVGRPYSLTFRYALFESDDYYSRISIYENDVLGSFSIPNLHGLGTRIYLLGKINIINRLSIYSRIGFTFTEVVKTDLKVELVWKVT